MGRLDQMLKEGINIPGENGYRMDEMPEWFDKQKFIKGRNVIHKFHVGFFLSSALGPVILSQYEYLMEPLLVTGSLETLDGAKKRVANTFQQIFGWINGDMFDPKDPSYKAILLVRGVHHNVLKKLNKTRPNRADGGVWMSQFEMAITLFSSIGPAFLYPKDLGIHATDCELEAVAHVWRVVGRQLGVLDEFNLCAGNFEEIRQICLEVVEKVKPTLMNPKMEYTNILYNTIKAIYDFTYLLDYEACLNYVYELIGLETRLPMSLNGYLCFYVLKYNGIFMQVSLIRDLFTPWYTKLVFQCVENYQSKRREVPKNNLSFTKDNSKRCKDIID